MITTGLVSVTFRKLAPHEIVALVVRAGQQCIEWGGDIHVPHGDLQRAREVAVMTADAGLQVAAYGSYYRVGTPDGLSFETVLESAQMLGAPLIRVWAGRWGALEASPEQYAQVVHDGRRIAGMAHDAGIRIAFEFHPNTLTDSADAAIRLYRDIDHPNVSSYWQPSVDDPMVERLDSLQSLLPYLTNLHVFHWVKSSEGTDQRPLDEGRAEWTNYLRAATATGRDHAAMLEFVKGESPEQYLADAAVLSGLVEELQAKTPGPGE
jgi:sugar phosphate isomerase/epimerase